MGSVALAVDGSVVARRFLTTPTAHASGLIPAIREVLGEAGVGVGQLAGIVAGSGPGSFTGVRIGAAAAKGLAASLEVPLYATSSLRAASFAVEALGPEPELPPEADPGGGEDPLPADPPREPLRDQEREVRYVVLDARHTRVYGACYDVGLEGPLEVAAPHGGTIVDVINSRPPLGTVFMGDGATAHAALLRAAGYVWRAPPAGVPVADAVLLSCRWVPVDPGEWEPRYVRDWKPG